MPNLIPVSSFDNVPELETNTLALGGPGGPMNLPAQALLNRTQWLKDNAVAGSAGPYASGAGSANALTAAFTPAITALVDGLKLRVLAAATNTGPATFAPNGLTAQPIIGGAYAALQGGEILANGEIELTWNATLSTWIITAHAGGSPQVPDATQSKQSANKGQVDQVVSDLASSASGKGAALVEFMQSGTGAVARTVQDKLSDTLHVKDFGAKGDGVTDDTAAIQAAINQAYASERPLRFHAGVFITTHSLTIPGPCQIAGAGRGEFAYGSLPATSITHIKYTGAAGGSVITIPASNMGGRLSGLHIDANNLAQIGLNLGSVLGWDFSDLYITGYTAYGLQLAPLAAYVANCMMNTFKRIHVYCTAASTIGVYITGAGAVCNSCHNTFELLTVDYGGAGSEGIRIGNADNCVFTQTYIFSTGSTGSGVHLYGAEAAGFPVSISFYHLQSGPQGFVQDAGVNDNFIFGYAQDNGQPNPVSGGRLFYVSTNGGISPVRSLGGMGTTPGSNLAGITAVATSATTASVTFTYPAEPSTQYAVQLTTTWQTTIAITSKSTTGFTVSFGTAAPASSSVHWLIVRTG